PALSAGHCDGVFHVGNETGLRTPSAAYLKRQLYVHFGDAQGLHRLLGSLHHLRFYRAGRTTQFQGEGNQVVAHFQILHETERHYVTIQVGILNGAQRIQNLFGSNPTWHTCSWSASSGHTKSILRLVKRVVKLRRNVGSVPRPARVSLAAL